ncbi:4-hydroxythreonine-4-phosphate dehydrogenase PdxA [Moraxella sp. ZJ142]|uniref:4-hydroxythreonine-4-phosphate dehydrogenase PdxA n=1 Tax=Moraxella marmotae TaxID=3344520 RepID=UPI0035D4B67B
MLITAGEPAGIGMDIVLTVFDALPDGTWLVAADADALFERAKLMMQSLNLPADEQADKLERIKHLPIINAPDDAADVGDDWLAEQLSTLPKPPQSPTADKHHAKRVIILHIPCHDKVIAGRLNAANAPMVEKQLHLAHQLAHGRQIAAIITTPIQKSIMIQADICLDNGEMFSGHTEYFMHKAGCDKVVMMLANSVMKVALVTTHLPLRAVPDAITCDEVAKTVQITHQALVAQFGKQSPKILVCGLNPHAGENGHLGDEENQIINPVLQRFIDDGMDISLAMPADTLFTQRHLAECDAVIAMYHDQGLAPLKSHGFGDTVNITLGLPYVRTSVDHGTALDLAGTGRASGSSLLQAIDYAQRMTTNP